MLPKSRSHGQGLSCGKGEQGAFGIDAADDRTFYRDQKPHRLPADTPKLSSWPGNTAGRDGLKNRF